MHPEKSLPARLCPCKSSWEMVVGDVERERVKPCQTTTRPNHVTHLNVGVTTDLLQRQPKIYIPR